ncbi:hypothetical protein ABID56_001312 [Alkalibacillus flavidus]|uniref:Uncharacterized protein n=1 Tax=Alkalibacillus flavidus TaxID=546021 RepID=A0ABV2KUH8_9BACI
MNAILEKTNGETVELDALIQGQKTVVTLVRHLG